MAREWHDKKKPKWSASHAKRTLIRLEQDIFPWLGNRPISDIEAPGLLEALRKVENHGAVETAHRIKQTCGQVFHAISIGKAKRDIAADLKDSLATYRSNHHASITVPKEIGALMRAIDGCTGSYIVRHALQLAPLVYVRPGELRHAEWIEFDLDNAEWVIPAEKMKMKRKHIVPLSSQAIAILRDIQQLTGNAKYVFHSERTNTRPMSENTINAALRRLGYNKD